MKVQIEEYNANWKVWFKEIKEPLWASLKRFANRIEHVGSTSIPNLAAKPIIDIDVVVSTFDKLPEIIWQLNNLCYEHRGSLGVVGREAFVNNNSKHPHHLYVCIETSIAFQNHIFLRDYLLQNPESAQAYGDLKKRLAKKFENDIDSYIDGKTDFILNILKKTNLSIGDLMEIESVNKKSKA